jgi:hypothetical protein
MWIIIIMTEKINRARKQKKNIPRLWIKKYIERMKKKTKRNPYPIYSYYALCCAMQCCAVVELDYFKYVIIIIFCCCCFKMQHSSAFACVYEICTIVNAETKVCNRRRSCAHTTCTNLWAKLNHYNKNRNEQFFLLLLR